LKVSFLGTAAARPSIQRNVSSLVVQREGETLMFDCGEGTQRQMMRYGTGFALNDIFFTHLHGDHFLGLTGLLRTLGLQERQEPIDLWTPAGTASILSAAVYLGVDRIPFEVRIHELEPEQAIERGQYQIVPFKTSHGGPSLGYSLVEHQRLGRFNPERARELGIPEGPLWGKLHQGLAVEVDGRVVHASELVGAPRPGRTVVVTGDTRPTKSIRTIAAGADLLIHEATFGADEADRARRTGHSTARDAARIARDAGVRRLALTHFSPRYADDPRALEREAQAVFPETIAAYDGLEIEVPYQEH
jgi:ribonuclease Z